MQLVRGIMWHGPWRFVQISLIGHSAGAQLATMALMHRAKHAAQSSPPKKGSAGSAASSPDSRMPKRLIGLAGVYDLAKHFDFEANRQVEELSTMKRAAGGVEGFPSCSPAVILAHTLRAVMTKASPHKHRRTKTADTSPPLRGTALATRIGFERPHADMAASLATDAAAAAEPDLQLSLADARRLPPVVLMSGAVDKVVPWYQSAEMFWMLHDAGCPVKHLCYPFVDHVDFVTGWTKTLQGKGSGPRLPDQCTDLLAIITEKTPVEYC